MKEVVTLYKVVREDSSEEMTFEQRPKMKVSLKVHEDCIPDRIAHEKSLRQG